MRARKIAVDKLILPATRGHLRVSTTEIRGRGGAARQRPRPRPLRRLPQRGLRATSHRHRRSSSAHVRGDLGPSSLSGSWTCSPVSSRPQPLLPFSAWAARAGPARNPPAPAPWSQFLCAIARPRRPEALGVVTLPHPDPSCPIHPRRGAVFLPGPAGRLGPPRHP